MKYILAHDLGTSGNKATLFAENGEMVASCIEAYDCHFFNGNWAEQSPEDFWKAVCRTTRLLLEKVDKKDIAVVAFSGQMMGCICVDSNGDVLRDSIIWADQRAKKQEAQIRKSISDDSFFHITGHRNSQSYGIQKLMWVKDNEPHIYDHTYKMLNCKDYIVYKLTGNFVTDYTDAASTDCLDINKMEWSETILEAAEIAPEKMPELHASTDIVGHVTHKASLECGLPEGTPVVLGGGDGCCAAAGAGSTVPGKLYCCLGSSAWVSYAAKTPLYDEERRIFNWPGMQAGIINPCGTMQAAGLSYSWMRDNICLYEKKIASEKNLAIYDLINQQIEASPVGANGLMFLPYLLGERSPRWNPDVRGTFIGLKAEHGREDFLRSVVEGVTMNLNVILGIFKNREKFSDMLLIGGGAKSKVWSQIIADCFGVEVLLPDHAEETTSIGAALAGGIGVGIYEDFSAVNKYMKIERKVFPDEEAHRQYEKMMDTFNEAYECLEDLYHKIAQNN